MPLSTHEVLTADFLKWPEKLKEGREVAHTFLSESSQGLTGKIDHIAFMGMGGSGIAGRIIKNLLGKESVFRFTVVDTPTIPLEIQKNTLVFVSSYSGDTWEVLHGVRDLASRGVQAVMLTRGGQLAHLAGQYNFPVITVPEALSPRASLGFFIGILLTVISLWVPDAKDMLEELIVHAEAAVGQLGKEAYYRDFLDFYQKSDRFYLIGVAGDTDAAIYRAQTQFNENAKNPVVAAYFPECAHNLLNGFFQPKGQVLVAILATDYTMPEVIMALDAFSAVLVPQGIALYKIPVLGNTWPQQFFHGIMWADYASCLVGNHQRIDVMAVPMITEYKAKYRTKTEQVRGQ